MNRLLAGRVLALLALLTVVAVPRVVGQGVVGRAEAATGPIAGVDVSKYQHDNDKAINWKAVKASGQRFAFIKATGGSNRVDPWFHREWPAAKAAGLVVGAYHYATPDRANPRGSAESQAALVVNTVGTTREAGNLGIVLDLESTGGLKPKQLIAWAHTFLRAVERRTGRTPILYTYVNFWKTAMASDRSFGAYPLWLARYAKTAPGPLPGWTQWTFWQRTSSHRVPGIPGLVDHNHMCCGSGTLTALADGRSRQIAALWRSLGGASGRLGLPLGPEAAVPGGWGQTFQKGYAATTRAGTYAVTGAVWDRYRASGGASALGPPTRGQQVVGKVGDQEVIQQLFTGARIVHSSATGAHVLRGAVLSRWLAGGGISGTQGLPTGELVGGGQQFVRGGLYVVAGGTRFVPGAIRDRYEELGGPSSGLGLPTSEPSQRADGITVVSFEHGQLTEVRAGGLTVVV